MVLLRFAPSPTGPLHLGGLRTALYNYLYARKLGGKWILRIEDTDATRTVPGAVDGIRKALQWAGLEFDYGPGKPGPHAPYVQSERLDLYHFYAGKLLDSGHAYRCFCSPDRLATAREKLARTGSNATYDKACLHLTEEEVARKVRAGEKSTIRLNDGSPLSRDSAPDLIFGTLRDAHASLPTDPILLKSDLFPTYHLASVVDDHEMGITHVLRGEEWLPSLPLHLDLYAALSIRPPQFAHLPLLLNKDGSKMSKRKGDVRVLDYQLRGWEPIAVLNWLALAGWGVSEDRTPDSGSSVSDRCSGHAPDSTKVMSLAEMIKEFDLSSLTHRRTILDPMKLEFLNKHHLMATMSTSDGLARLAEQIHDVVKMAFPSSQHASIPYIGNVITAMQGRAFNLNDIPALAPYFFVDPDLSSGEARAMFRSLPHGVYSQVIRALSDRFIREEIGWNEQSMSSLLHDEITKHGLKPKVYMTVLRHALSGMKTGPSVATTLHVLGRERSLERLANAEKYHHALQASDN